MSALVRVTNSYLRRPGLPANTTIARSRMSSTAMSEAISAGESTSGSRNRLAETLTFAIGFRSIHSCRMALLRTADMILRILVRVPVHIEGNAARTRHPRYEWLTNRVRPMWGQCDLSDSACSLRRWHRLSCPPSIRGYGSGLQAQQPFRYGELGVEGVAKRICGLLRIPKMRIADNGSESPLPIRARSVGLFVPTGDPHIGIGFALQFQEAFLL
jgi:hypothetical protein